MPDEDSQETGVDSKLNGKEKRSELRDDSVEPIEETTFNRDVRKSRRTAVEESDSPVQLLPFEIEYPQISSQIVSHPRFRASTPYQPQIRPQAVEKPLISTPTQPRPPQLRVREEVRLQPHSVPAKHIHSTEIGLPPRPLLSVTAEGGSAAMDADADSTEKELDDTEDIDSVTEDEGSKSAEVAADEGDSPVETGDLLEFDAFLFEMPDGGLASRDPLCIVAANWPGEEYKQTLETLCREQFRQLSGGKPHAELLAENEGEALETARAGNRIISYDADSDKNEYLDFRSQIGSDGIGIALEGGDLDLSRLHSRIDEFFTEPMGYLLLFVDEKHAQTLYDHLRDTDEIREPTQLRFVRPRLLPDDVKRALVQLAWGHVPIDTASDQLDRLFQTAETEFMDALEPTGAIEEFTDRGPDESIHHYWVKCLVLEWLLGREDLTPIEEQSRLEVQERIPTENQLAGDEGPIPDVYHERSKQVFEVETLYGTDHKKISRTIDKYEGVNVKQVNVVLPNLTLLRNLDDILRKRQEQPGEMFRNEVQFWTLNVAERSLVPLEDVISQLSDLQKRAEMLW